jgi:hypothetical protein
MSYLSSRRLALIIYSRRRLGIDIAAIGLHPTDLQLAKLRERSNSLRRRIKGWFKIQQLYMPEAAFLREADERRATDDLPAIGTEDLRLYLPSQLPRNVKCTMSLLKFEWQLRHAQANDALNELRDHLRLRSQLWKHKTRFEVGQRPNTRARNVIERCNAKINLDVKKYRTARASLVTLGRLLAIFGWEARLQPLEAGDVRELEADEDEGKTKGKKRQLNEGRRARSWIWQTPGLPTGSVGNLHDGMFSRIVCDDLLTSCRNTNRVV